MVRRIEGYKRLDRAKQLFTRTPSNYVSVQAMREQLLRQGGRCSSERCKHQQLEFTQFSPWSVDATDSGRPHVIGNFTIMCKDCNASKKGAHN